MFDGAATHASAHQQQMGLIGRDAQRLLGFLLGGVVVKHLPNGNTTANHFGQRDVRMLIVIFQDFVRNEIQIQITLLCTRAAGVIGCHKARFDIHGMLLQHLSQNHGRKHMNANDTIILAIPDEFIHPFCAAG